MFNIQIQVLCTMLIKKVILNFPYIYPPTAKACGKDCSKTALDWKCGSDGQWRRNLCFLNQANCNLKHGEKSIKNRHNTELCGKYVHEDFL